MNALQTHVPRNETRGIGSTSFQHKLKISKRKILIQQQHYILLRIQQEQALLLTFLSI